MTAVAAVAGDGAREVLGFKDEHGVAKSRACYAGAREAEQLEGERLSRLANLAVQDAREAKRAIPRICVWGANRIATRLGFLLAELGWHDAFIIDNAKSKIGTRLEGFDSPVQPPVFTDTERGRWIFLLCAADWNDDIAAQIKAMELEDCLVISATDPTIKLYFDHRRKK
jgi:hypothetical protein